MIIEQNESVFNREITMPLSSIMSIEIIFGAYINFTYGMHQAFC